jgi:monofunctional biosynthetic peptidoglycan transglycosylase
MKHPLQTIIRWLRNLLLLFFISSLLLVVAYKYLPVPYTPNMLSQNVKQLTTGEKVHLRYQWEPLKNVSPRLIQAVIASEDYFFLIHKGFDSGEMNPGRRPPALYRDNATISQQTARKVFLFPLKNDCNKLLETYFTLLVEFVWGKRRIMEVYLNTLEIGEATFGAAVVSRHFFDTSVKNLDARQAAMIAACLVGYPNLNPSEPTAYLLKRQAKIMSVMENIPEIQWE